jgi:hypothetical protein
MSFRAASRERLREELAAAVKRRDIQSVHSIIAENRGDAIDVAAVIGTSPAAEQLRQALVADYRDWAAEMSGDDVADDVPAVLVALAQPSLFSSLELS